MATRIDILSPDRMRDLLVAVVAGAKAEPEAKWREIVGEIDAVPAWRNPRGNWSVRPKGTRAQIAAVEQCVDIVRAEHPLVSA